MSPRLFLIRCLFSLLALCAPSLADRSDLSLADDHRAGLIASCEEAYPPVRYSQDDCFRAGWPHAVRKWAGSSTNDHYSAWYVGGGAPGFLPCARNRTREEGTWGLDYSLWSQPKQVWLKWSRGRELGGLGAYETDH